MNQVNYLHSQLNSQKWFAKSLIEQMANIGAEVGRAMTDNNNNEAFMRAIELLDLTIEDPKNHESQLKELCRLKAVLVDYFIGENTYGSSNTLWDNYFYFFNAAATAKYFR